MKKTKILVRNLFTMLFVFGLCGIAGFAQSTNIDSPTELKKDSIQWQRRAPGNTVVYYYSFTAGPGTVEITTDQRSVGIVGNDNLSWELTDTKLNQLGSEMFFGVTTKERKISEVSVDRKQKVLLKITVTGDVQEFMMRFSGAVDFGGAEDVPEITGDNETSGREQICMPRNGVMILTMTDGKKAKVDLSKVQKIEIQ